MDNDKRRGDVPIPLNLAEYLNEDQLLSLRQIERFGWELAFVRRPAFRGVVPVVLSAEGDRIGVLEEDGRLNVSPDIRVRAG